MIVTEMAVIEVTPNGLLLREVAPSMTPDAVQNLTEAQLRVAPDLKTIRL
jgi:3-oxoacid CoA-transferase subunit B